MLTAEIIEKMPYSRPFLFMDALESITKSGSVGNYTFRSDSFFYKGHFKDNPVTPGVILTECCAQIGVVALGIFLLKDVLTNNSLAIGMSSTEMEFLKPVLPNEKVRVISQKQYFRFNKLKCSVKMYDSEEDLVCRGTIAGMILNKEDAK